MSYVITNQCIQCDRCLSNCPNHAVQKDEHHYWIDANLCNGCEGVYRVPQCWAACPTNEGCVPFTESVTSLGKAEPSQTPDYWDSWFNTYNRVVVRLKKTHAPDYWQRWFDAYSSNFSKLKSSTAYPSGAELMPGSSS